MRYRIQHVTTYTYTETVPVCHNVVMLTPREAPGAFCEQQRLGVTPQPRAIHRRHDAFGNVLHGFSIEEPHQRLRISATSQVHVKPAQLPALDATLPWETVRDTVLDGTERHWTDAIPFVFDSPRIRRSIPFAEYARSAFPPGRPLLAAALDLTRRVHADFEYDKDATHVATRVEEAFELRRGVCQDFAHVQVACLRSLGLAARYVSGYVRTVKSATGATTIGSDESHAWVSLFAGPLGWIDFDPTNQCLCRDDHIPVAWGRDYGDVVPIRGVFLGGGTHHMQVSVDVQSLDPIRRSALATEEPDDGSG